MPTAADPARDAVIALLEDYVRAFETGTREDLQSFCRLPVAYITDDEVQLRDRYPFDPVKLRAATGLARSEMRFDVMHIDAHRAHVSIEGTRQRGDGSVIEGIQAIYILHNTDAGWRISAISGVRVPSP